jgi:hypothetical protein
MRNVISLKRGTWTKDNLELRGNGRIRVARTSEVSIEHPVPDGTLQVTVEYIPRAVFRARGIEAPRRVRALYSVLGDAVVVDEGNAEVRSIPGEAIQIRELVRIAPRLWAEIASK